MRLQKFLSQSGYCSRAQAEQLIKERHVTVNGKLAHLGDQVDGEEVVEVDGRVIQAKKSCSKVLCFHKPKGVACSLSPSPSGESLLDFDFGKDRFFPIGYLDHFAEGILLLTNDGALCNKLTQKSSILSEGYTVELDREISEEESKKFLRQMAEKVKKISIKKRQGSSLELAMVGGRSKDIRKIFEKQSITLRSLTRHSIGSYSAKAMAPAEICELSNGEIAALYN